MIDSQTPEDVWSEILSRRPARIRRVFLSLDASSQQEVLAHLFRMTTNAGWQDVQIASAAFALKTINAISNG
jgi:hypothetical protein